jgi:hypothetical protein
MPVAINQVLQNLLDRLMRVSATYPTTPTSIVTVVHQQQSRSNSWRRPLDAPLPTHPLSQPSQYWYSTSIPLIPDPLIREEQTLFGDRRKGMAVDNGLLDDSLAQPGLESCGACKTH